MKIFMLDNYDSFTYNLVQYFQILGCDVTARRCDCTTVDAVFALRPDAIVLSPGPGRPDSAGILLELIREGLARQMPMLGVCLGHQAIGEALGGDVIHAQKVMHGKTSRIRHDGQGLFAGLPEDLSVVRYHSLAVDRTTLPADLMVTAETDDGEIMGLRHRTLPVEGIQYHPESMLTERGIDQLENFLKIAAATQK